MKTLKFLSLFLIITLLGCTEENYYTTAEGLGKVNVYIEGNITNAEAQAQLEEEIGTLTENIYVQNTTQLTDVTINFSNNIRDIIVKNNPNLKNITLQGSNNTINEFQIYDGHYLNNITIKGIVEANAIYLGSMASNYNLSEHIDIECYDLVTVHGDLRLFIGQYNDPISNKLNFYDLKFVNKTIRNSNSACRWQGNYSEFNMPQLEEVYALEHFVHALNINYPKLKKAGGLSIGYGPSNQVVSFPLLDEITGGISFYQNPTNSTFDFPLLDNCGGIYLEGTNCNFNFPILQEIVNLSVSTSQSTINFPILHKIYNRLDTTSLSFTVLNLTSLNYCVEYWHYGIDLSSSTVNMVLNKFLTFQPSSGKYLNIQGEQPTGQGITDKQTLVDQGNSVLIY